MSKQLLKDAPGWGFILWLIGYILGFVFFCILPAAFVGWAILPIGILITLLVLFKRIRSLELRYYLYLSIVWMAIAVLFDYLFIVLLLKPADGYYKLDVYLYYALTFIIPLAVGYFKKRQ